MKALIALVISLTLFPFLVNAKEKIKVTAYTSVLPPFTNGKDSQEPGFLHELVSEIAQRANVDLQIKYMPWKRAQEFVKKSSNSIIFGLAKTKTREPNYSWIVETLTYHYVFASTKRKINSYNQAIQAEQVLVLIGTPREKILKEKKFSNLRTIGRIKNAVNSINLGRSDAWFTLDLRAVYAWNKAGHNLDRLMIGKPLRNSKNWIAANKYFPEILKERLRNSFKELKENGFYDMLYKKYFEK